MLSVKLLQWVRGVLLFQVGLDLTELFAEFPVEDLVVQDILEVRSCSGTVKLQCTLQLPVL